MSPNRRRFVLSILAGSTLAGQPLLGHAARLASASAPASVLLLREDGLDAAPLRFLQRALAGQGFACRRVVLARGRWVEPAALASALPSTLVALLGPANHLLLSDALRYDLPGRLLWSDAQDSPAADPVVALTARIATGMADDRHGGPHWLVARIAATETIAR